MISYHGLTKNSSAEKHIRATSTRSCFSDHTRLHRIDNDRKRGYTPSTPVDNTFIQRIHDGHFLIRLPPTHSILSLQGVRGSGWAAFMSARNGG